MATAIAVLDTVERENLQENAKIRGGQWEKGAQRLVDLYPQV